MALVFTAISNSVCSTLLRAESNARANAGAYTQYVDAGRIGLMGISKGGMETYLAAAVDSRLVKKPVPAS